MTKNRWILSGSRLTAWSGVPGGIFAPALAIGAALGNDVALLTGSPQARR